MKEVFASTHNFDELVEQFVFYMPVVHHLIGDRQRIAIPTDIVSHALASVMQEHPLVVTNLTRTVFRFDERLMVGAEVRSFCRTLYAVPTDIWNQTLAHLRMLTVFDHTTLRFCVLTPHRRDIRNPIGSDTESRLPVHYFNCYGNRETWFFTDDPLSTGSTDGSVPLLCYHPPIREFMELADRALRILEPPRGIPMEKAVTQAAAEMENDHTVAAMLAIRQQNGLQDKTSLNLSPIDDRTLREYHDLIRFYESVFGTA